MKYIKIKNLEKHHPGYKDRNLLWAKMHIKMIQGDHLFEMIDNEIDKWRFVVLVLLELYNQAPTPLDKNYLMRKGFDLKKRSIDTTIQSLNNFVTICNELGTSCNTEVYKEEVYKEDKEEDKDVGYKNHELLKWQKEKFEKIWLRYPRREGKSIAFKHFCRDIKTGLDWGSIKLALANYKENIEKENTEAKYIKMGSTWFNQWEDWIKHPMSKNEYT